MNPPAVSNAIIHKIPIIRIKNNAIINMEDDIIDETVLSIVINTKKSFDMVFSTSYVSELAAGFLYTQGIIQSKKEIQHIDWIEKENTCHLTLSPDCMERLEQFKKGRPVKGSSGGTLLASLPQTLSRNTAPDLSLSPAQVLNLIDAHKNQSAIFHKTGAVHSAGLCTPEGLTHYFEDIGRHNAVDKLAGHVLLGDEDSGHRVATLSCRMSLEIIGKIIKTKIPIVISNAAPTLSAVHLADQAGLTVIGFARDNRFNIYTHPHRIQMNGTH